MKRKKILSISALALSTLLVFACGHKKNDDTNNSTPIVPSELSFNKPAAGTELTSDQISELRSLFTTNKQFVLPPGELVFSTKKMNYQDRMFKEQKLKNKNIDSYKLLKDIQANCGNTRPTAKINTSFPANGDFSLENLRAGDRADVSVIGGLTGDNCPVKYDVNYGLNAYVTEADSSKQSLNVSGGATAKTTGFMMAPKYQALLNARGLVVDSNMTGLNIKQDSQNNKLFNFKLSGTYYSLKEDIPYSASVQSLVNTNQSDFSVKTETIITMTITTPRFPVQVDIHTKYLQTKSSEKILAEEYYLNGHAITAEKFVTIIGSTNPATKTSRALIKASRF